MSTAVASTRANMTIGQVAKHLARPVHQVEYAIDSRNIVPVGRAGNYRLFGAQQVEQIAAALAEIDSRKASSAG